MREELQKDLRELYIQIYGEKEAEQLLKDVDVMIKNCSQRRAERQWLTQKDVVLITYGDSITNKDEPGLKVLNDFLKKHVADTVSMVHILPMFPYTSDDGFSVSDYRKINPTLGDWDDVNRLGESYDLMFDAVINHCSKSNEWFQKCLQGEKPYKDFFIEADKNADYSKVIRPRALPLKEKGFDVPQNWDDVLEIAKAFYDPNSKQYGIALPTSESAFSEQVFSQFAISNGANVFNGDGTVTIDTPEMKEALNYYKELASYSMPGSTEVADVKDAFVNQNAPLCLYSTYILRAVQEAGFLDDVELALPNKTQQAAYGCVIVLSIASGLGDAEKAAAEKFVSFMLEKENNESWLLMAPGGIQPVLSEVAEDAAYKENEAIVPLAHLLDEVGVAFDNLQLFGCVDGKNYMVMGDVTNKGILSKMINNVVVQGSDPQTELANAQAEVEAMSK